jgi:hypothetical protein
LSVRADNVSEMSKARWANLWTRRRNDAAALASVLLFFGACFGRFIWRGQFLIGGDVFFYTHPLRTVAWEMIRHGQLPLWTPHVMSGYPLLAMTQLGLGYPLTWAHLLLPSHWAEELYVLAPFLLAPAFTYIYARTIRRTPTAALLAALSFGYGGLMTNTNGMNGIPTNALMWLPLMLVVLERARTGRFVACLVKATSIYSLSVLTGHGQSFMQVGTLALAYALCLALSPSREQTEVNGEELPQSLSGNADDATRTTSTWARWRPLFVTAGALALACGVAAFQILETLRATRRSIRSTLSYDFFSAGGFTPTEALRSFIAPLYHYTEVTTYQAPLVACLAATAVVCAVRARAGRDPRIFFWLAVALVAFILLLGGHTPLYRLLYRVPVFNLFRRPTRYACEWTFAVSILAAYGWDARAARAATRVRNATAPTVKGDLLKVLFGGLLLLFSAVLGLCWWRAVRHGGSESAYLDWKLCFTLATTLAVIYGRRVLAPHAWGASVATCALLLVCLVEPFILIDQWWPGTAKPGARFTTPALTTRWLQQFAPTEQRVYVRANGPAEETSNRPRFDALNRTALFNLHNVAGYEQLLMERYSRALGNVDFDSLSPRPGYAPTRALFEPRSHVLDLLNTAYVVAWPDLAVAPAAGLLARDGVNFAAGDLGLTVAPGQTATLLGATGVGDELALVTSLANSVVIKQGTPVARLRVFTNDGRTIERELRAGVDTAEWAHERADVRLRVQHRLAPVFDEVPGDAPNSFSARRYWTRLMLGAHVSVSRIELENVAPQAALALWKATLYDATARRSTPLTNEPDATAALDAARWPVAAEMEGVLILRNLRACPRAWLVAEGEAVDGEEALRRISGVSPREFDPRRTALLEVSPDELPQLSGAAATWERMTAHVSAYEPSHLVIDTDALAPTVLVVSESFYPGWVATVDGQPARILLTDYLLRGVALPPGRHRVEMRYTAPAARGGAIISACTLLLLGGLFVYSRRRSHLV